MTGTPTPNWAFPTYDGTEPGSLKTIANAQANAAERAMNNAAKGFFLQYTSKAALLAVPTTGLTAWQKATVAGDPTPINNGDYVWNGTAWIAYGRGGLVAIAPTTATGLSGAALTIDANGKVSFTAAQSLKGSIILNGVFSSAFSRYVVHLNTATAGGAYDTYVNFATGGVINTAASYYGSSVAMANQAGWQAGSNSTLGRSMDFHLDYPANPSNPTIGYVTGVAWDSSTGNLNMISRGIGFAGNNAFDGFVVNFNLGATSSPAGEIQVFGYLD